MAGRRAAEMIDEELLASLIPEGAVEQQIGFAPYWIPEIGKKFKAFVFDRENKREVDDEGEEAGETSGNFDRYLFNASEEIDCLKGPSTNPEEVKVMSGEDFTTSCYGSMDLDKYVGFEITLICVGNQKLPGNKKSKGAPRDMWIFKVFTDARTDRLLKEARKKDAEARRAFIQATRMNALNRAPATKSLPNGNQPAAAKPSAADAIT